MKIMYIIHTTSKPANGFVAVVQWDGEYGKNYFNKMLKLQRG